MTTLDLEPRLYTNEEFQHRLTAEVERAVREGRPYALVACVPQHLPGEYVTEVVDIAAERVRDFVRQEDMVGRPDDDVVAVGLPGTAASEASVLAHRLQGDLRLRSFHQRATLWETGVAALNGSCSTAQELLASAVDAARNRRRRLGG